MSSPSRPEDRQPPDSLGGTAGPEATVGYRTEDERSSSGVAAEGGGPSSATYAFLDPPRDPGELGWLAHYRIRRCIGEGGMGLVFEAEDTDLLRPVALKVIRPQLADSPQIAHRFLREARAMAALKHDHVVTIYQVGQERGVPYLAMEYLRGIALSDWLERGHTPSLKLVLRLGREVAAGLAAAHQRGVIHRDIKPANIWLEAPQARVKILDFGLARAESDDVQLTNPGTSVGSPAYMAPEQARGEGGGASSDLFSLGCVLYRLGTGELPFPGKTITAVLTSLAVDTPAPPRQRNPAVPPALDELVMRLLAKEPADRPASAQAVVEAIGRIERALLAQRQRTESPAASSRPVLADSTRPAPGGIDVELPQTPSPAVKARTIGGTARLAAAVALLGMALVATGVALFWRNARTVSVAPPAPITVAATDPGRAVPEPVPTPSPARPIAPPKTAAPPPETKPEIRAEGSREEPRGEAPRAAVPDQAQPQREAPAKPEPRNPVQPAKEAGVAVDWGDVVDPAGDCLVVRDRQANRATILVTGTAHLLSAEIGLMNAPRILRSIAGDFEVRVRVTGTSQPGGRPTTKRYNPYHGAGILLWQDPKDYVRLEIAADLRRGMVFPYVNFELRQAGRLAVSQGFEIRDGSS
ncbi:MAG: protein kinase, partial [Solirubrobacterales bacterium]|nr:protein kinase [Solirubrobacterales bacterium]